MTRQFNRRALIAGTAAVGGAALAARAREVGDFTSRLGSVRLQPRSSEPIYVAMLDRHAQRIGPLVPGLERTIGRAISIDALPAEQLYANYTIDLLQQTGRYDVVSINDHWIPYFGRRGYLSEVGGISDADPAVVYPPLAEAAAEGIDGSRLVAYPWTLDFTCSAIRDELHRASPDPAWHELAGAIEQESSLSVGLDLQSTISAAEVYRSVLLSCGHEALREDDGEPILDHYWQQRSLDLIVRMARAAGAADPLTTSSDRVVALARDGAINLAPVLWASDSRSLSVSPPWTLRPLPYGRPGRRRSYLAVWMLGVPAGAPNGDQAREFVEALTSFELQSRLWSSASLVPATRTAIQSSEPDWLPMRGLTFDALDRGQLRPRLRSYRAIMQIIGQAVTEAVSSGASTTNVLAGANRRIREVLVLEDELEGLS